MEFGNRVFTLYNKKRFVIKCDSKNGLTRSSYRIDVTRIVSEIVGEIVSEIVIWWIFSMPIFWIIMQYLA